MDRFPFHQGRFQGQRRFAAAPMPSGFHSTKEGFKGSQGTLFKSDEGSVSIPPRKVSRSTGRRDSNGKVDVSIPPRKVSRKLYKLGTRWRWERFHSTKEGFKAYAPHHLESSSSGFHSTKEGFKVVKRDPTQRKKNCFHSTKEGFKGYRSPERYFGVSGFHSTKEGFKGRRSVCSQAPVRRVSIPPRKVSREGAELDCSGATSVFPFHQGRFQGTSPRLRSVASGSFPFHQGRFQGVLAAQMRTGGARVSIPPRKVSRQEVGYNTCTSKSVSIPPRKVSRGAVA